MKVTLTKITIITESLLVDRIVEILKTRGSTGHTLSKVEGEGSRGDHTSDWVGRNTKIETIVGNETADNILSDLNNRYFEDFSIVAWLSEVQVLRGDKFTRK
ncbi:MAG: P-II family nitrogen regulator [Opitutales bacterium]